MLYTLRRWRADGGQVCWLPSWCLPKDYPPRDGLAANGPTKKWLPTQATHERDHDLIQIACGGGPYCAVQACKLRPFHDESMDW